MLVWYTGFTTATIKILNSDGFMRGMKKDDYAVWVGIVFVALLIIGATAYVPLFILSLVGLAFLTLSSVIAGMRR